MLKTEEAFEEEEDRILEPEELDDEDGDDETEDEEKEHRCSMFFHEQRQLVYFYRISYCNWPYLNNMHLRFPLSVLMLLP